MFLESIVAANVVRPWLKYLAVAIAVLAAVWAWNRWLDGRDAAAFERGVIAGRAQVQPTLDKERKDRADERAAQLADQAQRERDAREKENTLRTQIDKNRKASDEKLRTLAAARDRDLEQLRNRPARPPEPVAGSAVPANPGADKPPEFGCTGAGLAGPDAAFLVRETARAIELKEHLRACYAHVDKLELELNGPPDRPKP